jgi:hypothetical protein
MTVVPRERYFVTRAWMDDPKEWAGDGIEVGESNWLFTIDDETYMGEPQFDKWLREIGVKPDEIEWEASSGMDFSDSSYAYITPRSDPEQGADESTEQESQFEVRSATDEDLDRDFGSGTWIGIPVRPRNPTPPAEEQGE